MNMTPPTTPGAPAAAAPVTAASAGRCPAHVLAEGALDLAGPTAPAAFVALSRFVIANGMGAEVKAAFRARPHLVDGAPGYLRMEVISPHDQSEEIWLLTFWTDEASFRTWHRSHVFRDSHKGIPRGLKLVPHATELRCFDHIAS